MPAGPAGRQPEPRRNGHDSIAAVDGGSFRRAISLPTPCHAQSGNVLTGKAAFIDWQAEAPGVRRLIKPQDLPPPFATEAVRNRVQVVVEPGDRQLKTVPGFEVKPFAKGLEAPRLMRTAPNGDVFVAESNAGRIRVLRPSADGSKAEHMEVFASGLKRPFGINFYPANGQPEWVYVANTDSVVRFPYRAGDLKARGAAEVIVAKLPSADRGHWTRDVVFSQDGSKMFVSVGSASNFAQEMPALDDAALKKWIAEQPLGAAWGPEEERAAVLAFDPDGKNRRLYATGIRNCVGMAIHPATGDLWCSTNERDLLGDDLPPDYITRVKEGAFYGWPWYYIGAHEDPRLKGARPDLKDKVTVPDVLLQAHAASLQMLVYDGGQFPAEYKGQIFAALHGSWNRQKRLGYKIIRAMVKDGVPTGEYEDFVTGFVVDDASVWGRPVGVTVAKDGALLFSEDGNGTVWRVSHSTRASAR
jgi:glucose/arabinose dehydrogenase